MVDKRLCLLCDYEGHVQLIEKQQKKNEVEHTVTRPPFQTYNCFVLKLSPCAYYNGVHDFQDSLMPPVISYPFIDRIGGFFLDHFKVNNGICRSWNRHDLLHRTKNT